MLKQSNALVGVIELQQQEIHTLQMANTILFICLFLMALFICAIIITKKIINEERINTDKETNDQV